MDVGSVLRQARSRLQISQRELAERAGTSRSSVSEWESGAVSPSVATLTRVLAACGLRLRPVLETRGAELEAQVDALLAGQPHVPWEALAQLAMALDDAGVTWAVDGTTALAIHGLAFPTDVPSLAVVVDHALWMWLFRGLARVLDGGVALKDCWFADPVETDDSFECAGLPGGVPDGLPRPIWSRSGLARLRPVTLVPAAVSTVVPPGQTDRDRVGDPPPALVVPVLAVHEVERGHPELSGVLACWRRRTTAG